MNIEDTYLKEQGLLVEQIDWSIEIDVEPAPQDDWCGYDT